MNPPPSLLFDCDCCFLFVPVCFPCWAAPGRRPFVRNQYTTFLLKIPYFCVRSWTEKKKQPQHRSFVPRKRGVAEARARPYFKKPWMICSSSSFSVRP